MARKLAGELPAHMEFRLLGSFAHTLTGHGTDKALVAGMIGFAPDDLRIRSSFAHAREAGLDFTFTPLDCTTTSTPTPSISSSKPPKAGVWKCAARAWIRRVVIRKIDGVDVYITGENHSIVVQQRDLPGVLAHIATSLSAHGVNIATARLYREQRGDTAWTVLETDQRINDDAQATILENPLIRGVRVIPAAALGQAQAAIGEAEQAAALEPAGARFHERRSCLRFMRRPKRPPSLKCSCDARPPCSRPAGMPTARTRISPTRCAS